MILAFASRIHPGHLAVHLGGVIDHLSEYQLVPNISVCAMVEIRVRCPYRQPQHELTRHFHLPVIPKLPLLQQSPASIHLSHRSTRHSFQHPTTQFHRFIQRLPLGCRLEVFATSTLMTFIHLCLRSSNQALPRLLFQIRHHPIRLLGTHSKASQVWMWMGTR